MAPTKILHDATRLTLAVRTEHYEALRREAHRSQTSVAEVVRRLLDEWLKGRGK